MSTNYKDSKNKRTVRNSIDLPLIKDFSERYNCKLNYFGLPGSQITDLLSWKEYLGEIDAVEIYKAEADEMKLNLIKHDLFHKTRVYTQNIDKIMKNESEYSKDLKDYQLINLDYVGAILTQGLYTSRIECIEKLINNQKEKRNENFLLFITVQGQRSDPEQIQHILLEAKSNVDTSSNNADKIFDYLLSENAKQYEQLFVSIPIMIIYYGSHNKYGVECTSISIYKGSNDQTKMVHFTFEFNLTESRLSFFGNSLYTPIPLKAIKEVTNGKIVDFDSNIPEFTED